jgi:hypothetical protein
VVLGLVLASMRGKDHGRRLLSDARVLPDERGRGHQPP